MALIKCNNCGGIVSDKAEACPHCGCPVERPQICPQCGDVVKDDYSYCKNCGASVVTNDNTSDSNAQLQESNESYGKPKRKSLTGLLVGVVLGLLALLGIGGWLCYDYQQKRINLERLHEQARLDSIVAAELREKARQDSIAKAVKQEQIITIYNEYANVLKKHHEGRFFLFDITKDGTPELWVHAYNSNEIRTGYNIAPLRIFTIKDNRARELKFGEYNPFMFFGDLYQGSDYIIQHTIWDDIECGQIVVKYSYNENRIIEETIRDCDCEEIIRLSEPKIVELDITDFESLKQKIRSFYD